MVGCVFGGVDTSEGRTLTEENSLTTLESSANDNNKGRIDFRRGVETRGGSGMTDWNPKEQ